MLNSCLFEPEPGGYPGWVECVFPEEKIHSPHDIPFAKNMRFTDCDKLGLLMRDFATGAMNYCMPTVLGSVHACVAPGRQCCNEQLSSPRSDTYKHGAGELDELNKSRLSSGEGVNATLELGHEYGPAYDHLALDSDLSMPELRGDTPNPPPICFFKHSQASSTKAKALSVNGLGFETRPTRNDSDFEAFTGMCGHMLHVHDWDGVCPDTNALDYAAEPKGAENTAKIMGRALICQCLQLEAEQKGKLRGSIGETHIGSDSYEREWRQTPLAAIFSAWLLFALDMVRFLQP